VAVFEIGDIRVEPGETFKGVLGEVRLAPGFSAGVPVVIVNGAESGPTLVATAAAHGQEIVGTGALIAAVRRLEPTNMRGTLVAVMMANPLAAANATYATPYDGMNICSPLYWPPIPNGTITQRLASFISPALQRADYYMDLHGNADPAAQMTMMYLDQCSDDATRSETRRIAEAFGFTPVDMLSNAEAHNPAILGTTSGYPTAIANAHGIPAIMVELTGNGTMRDAAPGAIGILNVMRTAGMIDGDPEPQPSPRLQGEFVYYGALITETGGLLWAKVPPGQILGPGETLLEITDVWGETVEQIEMPTDGFAWGYLGGLYGSGSHAVPEGSMVGFVAKKVG
jgi:predicted deacylase